MFPSDEPPTLPFQRLTYEDRLGSLAAEIVSRVPEATPGEYRLARERARDILYLAMGESQ